MLSYTELKEKPKVLLSFTGLTSTEFDELLTVFSAVFRRRQEEKAATKERQRRPGGGRKPILRTDEDRLLFILYHLKLYVIQEVQAFMFGMGQSQANYWIHHLSPVLEEALAELNMLPERQGERMEKTLREGERPVFVQDASERRRNRPKSCGFCFENCTRK